MKPRAPLAELDQALADLLQWTQPLLPAVEVELMQADGRVLRQAVVSELNVPAFDNSSMDGWAIRCADLTEPSTGLDVAQRITAGDTAQPLLAGQAARIFTGAPVPDGADAVVMQELAHLNDQGRLCVDETPKPSQWIRRAGEDIMAGCEVLKTGDRLSPAQLGLLASLGLAKVWVSRKPKVALFSTGNELVMPGTLAPKDLPAGAIFNSNRYFLRTLLERLGVEVTDLGMVPDRLDLTQQALAAVADSHDLILTSGGVSVGEEDHVKPAVESMGELKLWSLSMKPGKPFAFGRLQAAGNSTACFFMGLPGNPVSSFVTFMLLVRPFLLAWQGSSQVGLPRWSVRADFDWPKPDKRREFIRVKRNADGGLDLYPNQSSGVLTSVAWADGVVDVPSGQVIQRGDWVNFIPWATH